MQLLNNKINRRTTTAADGRSRLWSKLISFICKPCVIRRSRVCLVLLLFVRVSYIYGLMQEMQQQVRTYTSNTKSEAAESAMTRLPPRQMTYQQYRYCTTAAVAYHTYLVPARNPLCTESYTSCMLQILIVQIDDPSDGCMGSSRFLGGFAVPLPAKTVQSAAHRRAIVFSSPQRTTVKVGAQPLH